MADSSAAGREILLASLTAQRRHVLEMVDDLPASAWRRPVLPSGWTCLGLINHLALDVERFWFRRVVAGEPLQFTGWGWDVPDDLSAELVLRRYRDEIQQADAILGALPLDSEPADWPDQMPGRPMASVFEVALHVMTETACHAGHLDAARELMDGRTWLILTG